MWHKRSESSPVLAGDITDEGTVAGFSYVRSGRPRAACDRLLLTGEETLAQPPDRPVPDNATSVRVLAATPVDRVAAERIHRADALAATLPDTVAEALVLPGSPWGAVATSLIREMHEAHHVLWLAGGFARDMIAGAAGEVNDLDLTGTAPPGRFSELTKRVRRRSGLEFRPKVSPGSLVCSAVASDSDVRLYEYRTLKSVEFGFPACGSDLEADARCRDFTVNSLYYDPVSDTVIDPTGQGLTDLRARPRHLVSLTSIEDPLEHARIVLRAVKFAVRWAGTTGYEFGELASRLAHLPRTAWDELTPVAWDRLAHDHRKTLEEGQDPQRQMGAAAALGPAAVELLATLLEVRP